MAIVKLENVEKVYPLGKTEVRALKGVSFEIEKGDFVSIAGPSGSGKSTILNLIGCIDTASAGSVLINGVETSTLSDKQITNLRHEVLGFILQSFNLIPVLSVYENVEFPLLLGKSEMSRAEQRDWVNHLVDVATLRSLEGLTEVRLDSAVTNTPVDLNEDDLFGGGDALSDDAAEESGTPLDFDTILGDTSVRDQYLAVDNNAWHFVLVDVAEDASATQVGEQVLSAPGIGANLVVEDWRWGAGLVAELAFGIRTALNAVILVISVVAVIIITNTLVISVTERMAEIGTIRAIGAQRGFVRGMIAIEVLMTTFVFGLVGIAPGSGVVWLLNVVGIGAPNTVLQVLFGGASLNPVLSLSSLYPFHPRCRRHRRRCEPLSRLRRTGHHTRTSDAKKISVLRFW